MQKILADCGLAVFGVNFIDRETLAQARSLLAKTAQELRAPGGTVANTLCSLRCGLGRFTNDFEVAWLGVAARPSYEPATSSPLDSLRRSGVVPYLGKVNVVSERTALVAVDSSTGRVISVNISPPDLRVEPTATWPVPETVVLTLQRAVELEGELLKYVELAQAIIVLIADASINPRASAFLRRNTGRLRALFGHRRELEKLGIDSRQAPPNEFIDADLVGTDGKAPVSVWDGKRHNWDSLVVPSADSAERPPGGNELGMGDAYAGSFLAARLVGSAIDAAHAKGCAAARDVLASPTSRALDEQNLNRVFGERLAGRESAATDEGLVFETVRRSCGVTIVTCGQTGIDQTAIRVASQLGLPSFAILPTDRRTEATDGLVGKDDDFGDSFVIELGSASYRYCTWVNVFCADGSLIWDYRGSEGSAETRIACRTLGRPFLDLATLDEECVLEECWKWAETHRVRIIHFAGNRASHLEAKERGYASRQMVRILLAMSSRRATDLCKTAGGAAPLHRKLPLNGYRSIRVGVPNTSESRSLLQGFLASRNIDACLQPRRRLYHSLNQLHLDIFFVRARDLCAMLDHDLLDAAFLGSDLVEEQKPDVKILLDTGLQPCLLALLGRSRESVRPSVIGSQYPSLAAAFGRSGQGFRVVHELRGTAEAWLATGFIDGVVDTWRTGATAYANDMKMLEVLAATFLVLVVRSGVKDEARQGVEAFAQDFGKWLQSGGLLSSEAV